MTAPEYLPGDNLPLPSTPPQEPSGTFSPAMHDRRPVLLCQPPDDLRPASGVLYAALAAGLIWVAVICLLSH